MSLVVLVFIWCAVFAVWWYLKPRRLSPPVYPGALPIIGHGHLLLGDDLQTWQTENDIYQFCSENGGVIEIRFGPIPVYVFTDVEDCLTIANTCFDKPYIYDFGRDMYGTGLVTAHEMIWKPHRKLINPAFKQPILNTFIQEYCAQAKRLVSDLAPRAGTDPFDVGPLLAKSVLRTVFKTTMGIKPNDCKHDKNIENYANLTMNYFDLLLHRFMAVWLHWSFIFNMSHLKKKQCAIANSIKNITEKIIKNRKLELKQDIYSDSINEAISGNKSFLDHLLDLGEKQLFTDDEIREHLDTVISAAYDTTSIALLNSLILLGSYPDIQARVFKEVREVLGDPERDLSRHDLPKLVYLEAVLKETLRLYPMVPRIARCNQSAVKINHYTFPAGSVFGIAVYGINRHPMWGPDANEFKPERWLDPAALPENLNAFASFSFGKRNCIGKQAGMMSMKVTLAYILRKYRVIGDISKVKFKCDLLLRPGVGQNISLEIRT